MACFNKMHELDSMCESPYSSIDSVQDNIEVQPHSDMDPSSKEPNFYPGLILAYQLEVKDILGAGGFGFVLKCKNIMTGEMAAVKVNRNDPEILDQAKHEIAMLERLRCLNPDICNIVTSHGYFYHEENICINFELLDQSLWHYMKDRDFRGLSMREVKPIIHQLATALYHLESIGMVHADLKPENVMVVNRHQQPLRVKLIDFGLAFLDKPNKYVQTIWFRAPEVILYCPLDQAIDMWSLGVTAVQLATGNPLYPGERESNVLNFIVETQGQPPDHVLDCGNATSRYFSEQSNSEPRWRFKTKRELERDTGYRIKEKRPMRLACLDNLQFWMPMDRFHSMDQFLLVELIKQMMHLDPEKRIKPQEVLQHEFFERFLPQQHHVNTCVDTDSEEETPDVSPQSPCSQPAAVDIVNSCIEIHDTRHEIATPEIQQCHVNSCEEKDLEEETPDVRPESPHGEKAGLDFLDSLIEMYDTRHEVAMFGPQQHDVDPCEEIEWEEEIPDVSPRSLHSQTPGVDISDSCIEILLSSTVAELDNSEAQPETSTTNGSWFRHITRKMTGTFRFICPCIYMRPSA